MAAPIDDLALVHCQCMMLGNLPIDGVHLVWAAVGPSEDMLPDDRLMGRTLWAKGTTQQAIASSAYHQLLVLGDGSCLPVSTIVLRVHHNVGQRALGHVLGGVG